MAEHVILVANPGSASRKYALFDSQQLRGSLHFEWEDGRVVCTVQRNQAVQRVSVQLKDIADAPSQAETIFRQHALLLRHEHITGVGVRIVAPSSYFLQNHVIDSSVIAALESTLPRAPLHIAATLHEIRELSKQLQHTIIVGVSDSAFHATKPDYAWNYGINIDHADQFEIKRFGYHGISVESVVAALKPKPSKLIVCHLGSGASVTAVLEGKSIDNTMGYSPLEGVIMSTRSGSIDPIAVRTLQTALKLTPSGIEEYLQQQSGLLGLGGSADIRELLQREKVGDHRARLALATYVYAVQKAIGHMAAALGGANTLVFTGTVGERSYPMRQRILHNLGYLGFVVDTKANRHCMQPVAPCAIQAVGSNQIVVIPATEAKQIAKHTLALMQSRQ